MKLPRAQFSLRTLLIVVTLLAIPCAYVAHEAQVVRHRKAELAWIANHAVILHRDGREMKAEIEKMDSDDPMHFKQRPSWLRRMLGDADVALIVFYNGGDVDRAAKAFPEASAVLEQGLPFP